MLDVLRPGLLAVAAALIAVPAAAADIFGGISKHNVPFASKDTHESGVDVQLGYRLDSVLSLSPAVKVQPYVLGSINTAGDTAFAAGGISVKFGGPIYVRPGVGIAVHDGPSYRVYAGRRTDLGSRVLFEPELAIGIMVAPRVSIEASWTHLSHAQLFSRQNPGIDMLGARLNIHLP